MSDSATLLGRLRAFHNDTGYTILGESIARIAELEAERDIVQSACNDISDQLRDRTIELKASAARIAELEAALDRVAKFIKDWDSGNPDTPDGWFYEEFSDEYAALMVAIRARPAP